MSTHTRSKKHSLFLATSAIWAISQSGMSFAAKSVPDIKAHAVNTTTIPLSIDSKGMVDTIHYIDKHQHQQQIQLSVNELNGITVNNSQGKQWQRAGNFALAGAHINHDSLQEEKDTTLVLTFFDNNTQEIVALHLVPTTLEVVTEFSMPMSGSEAICANATTLGDTEVVNTELVNIDANGELHQLLVTDKKFIPLRQFAIGPGIKSCAIDTQQNALYLADEFAGVWKMNTDMESELSRELIFHDSELAIEGVSVLSSSTTSALGNALVGWVSPDNSGIWLKNHCGEYTIDLTYPNGGEKTSIKPETLSLSLSIPQPESQPLSQARLNSQKDNAQASILTVRVDDDDSDNIFVAEVPMNQLPYHCEAATSDSSAPETVPKAALEIATSDTAFVSVTADIETQPVAHAGDAADDPSIWVNAKSPEKSLVIGTDKKGALESYDLKGALVQSLSIGRVNNVDVGYAVSIPSRTKKRENTDGINSTSDIAVASNRTNNSLSVLSISPGGTLAHLGDVNTTLNDIYGMCLFVDKGVAHVLANDTSGRYERHALSINKDHQVSGELVQAFSLPSQPEGCVIDGENKVAYLGEEGAGIWALDVGTLAAQPQFLVPISAPVEADIEGLALFNVDNVQYLIASSQGNNAYAIYRTSQTETPELDYVGLIQIEANFATGIDGVSETDGLEATNANLGGVFSEGLWVVQDGRNVMPSETQNFKLVSGQQLSSAIRALLQK